MGKGKKGGKRLTKKQLVPKLEELFSSNPGKTMSFKEIFRSLHLDTHPLKMLAIDIMEEMAWDDFITKVSDNSYHVYYKHLTLQPKRAADTSSTTAPIKIHIKSPSAYGCMSTTYTTTQDMLSTNMT